MTVRLWWATVYVRDMALAVEFYRDLLGVPVRFVSDEHSSFSPEGAMLEVERVDAGNPKSVLVGRATGIGIGVADLDAMYESLRARGIEFLEPPCKRPWGDYTAVVADPDGNQIVLGQVPEDWDAYVNG